MSDKEGDISLPPPSKLPDFSSINISSTGVAPPTSVLNFTPPKPPVLNPMANKQPPGGNPFAPTVSRTRPTGPTTSTVAPRASASKSPSPAPAPTSAPVSVKTPQAPMLTSEPPKAHIDSSPRPPPPSTLPNLPPVATMPLSQKFVDEPLISPPIPVSTNVQSPAVIPTTDVTGAVQTPATPASTPVEKAEVAAPGPSVMTGEDRVDMTGGLFGWITKTVTESKLLSDVAEKAKHGMESVLTTLDPGMRGLLGNDGMVEVFFADGDHATIGAVKDGFERVFANVMIRSVPSSQAGRFPLVSGWSASLIECRSRADTLLASKLVASNAAILVIQPFIVNIEGRYYSSTRLLLRWKGNDIDGIGQLLEVEKDVMKVLENRAKLDGTNEGKYSISVSQAAKELHKTDAESWAGPQPPYSFSELLTSAAASVALQFMNLTIRLNPE